MSSLNNKELIQQTNLDAYTAILEQQKARLFLDPPLRCISKQEPLIILTKKNNIAEPMLTRSQ